MQSSLVLDAISNKPSLPVSQSRGTLLIVDDEEGPRQSLRVVFKEDYNLLLASDGTRALELARQQKIDAAVIDIRMTGMNGLELLERLRAVQPGVEVIMLTAYETIDTIRQALRLGACDYLNKPFDIASIRKAVARAMERRSLADEIKANNEVLTSLQDELHNQRLQEEISRTRGDIYASIIHDINGPLTIICGFIQIITRRVDKAQRVEGEDLDMVRDHLKSIARQINNCIDISRRYLTFMRQRSTETLHIRVNQILDDLRELLEGHPSRKSHQLVVHTLTEDVEAQINGTDLIQIMLNLSINALQCSHDPHRVEVAGKIHPNPATVLLPPEGVADRTLERAAFRPVGAVVELSVTDNGPGISAENMQRLFQQYFTTKPVGIGTGLGLSIVHRLLKEAKGCLHVHSEPGQGSTFTIYLPVWEQAPPRIAG